MSTMEENTGCEKGETVEMWLRLNCVLYKFIRGAAKMEYKKGTEEIEVEQSSWLEYIYNLNLTQSPPLCSFQPTAFPP